MNAPQNPKRRHHHVWQHYLKPWTAGGALYCLQDERIFPTGTRAIAVENDFYKLDRLTDRDVAWIKLIFGQGHPSAVKTHAGLFNKLMMPFSNCRAIQEQSTSRANGCVP